MKNYYLLAITVILFINVTSCSKPKTIVNEKWSLVWEDDFKGKQIDTVKWSKIPRGVSDWNQYMSNSDELYTIKDGNLILRAIQNTISPNDTASYLTGGIYTKDKQLFGYGRLEIKAKMNSVEGARYAFWMLPEDAKWPEGGEVNILDRLSNDKFIYHTLHSNYTHKEGMRLKPPASTIVGMNPNNYNIYAFEKYQDSLVFYVNETKTKNYPRIETELEGQFPFVEQDFYLLLNLQLGGSSLGTVKTTQLPAEIHIDWVRFYEPANQ